ncbi:cellulose biosynthesis protein BcsN [Microvirga splendida]|uniref:Cellulose biosynthesis protein BcsN n=1 Tax=Microvirga splendida TaxID=2795727 RepID=A0ABS0XZ20_9HYPH|nr:cellulose biosynthesis protein BcsN [Microvirga splendida]MBJ6125297.1 cellulose biosynthesis protein BcsN [Microvirga splendida]
MPFGAAAPEAGSGHRQAGGLGPFLKLLAAVALMSVAACAGRSDLGYATLTTEVPATRAIVVPPPGGPSIVAVLQRLYQNGIAQEIALSTASRTSGQNAFYVSLLNNTASNMEIPETLSLPPLTPDRIEREMEERIPGVAMQTSLVYVQNKFGPFGFATGRSPQGDLCLYAWQRIEPEEPAILVPGGAISVRLRLCGADASIDQLLRIMYGYTISAYYRQESWNPYGDPPSPPAGFGQTDAPMYPLGLDRREDATVIRRRVLPSESHRAVVPDEPSGRVIDKDTVLPPVPAPTVPQTTSPLGGYPVVPPPPTQ